nr:MAG TPA: hypothetical protein [Caudoviricetes sp.]
MDYLPNSWRCTTLPDRPSRSGRSCHTPKSRRW